MADIPVANKHEDTAICQHIIPRCYMKQWCYNSNRTSVWLYERNEHVEEKKIDELSIIFSSKKINKINYIDNYYDIKAGCYFMPQDALNEIFGPTMHLKVTLDSDILDTEQKRNEKFLLFDEWVITDSKGVHLTNDERIELKKYFSEARFVFIEKEWGRQYENKWPIYIKNFEEKIRQIKANGDHKNNLIASEMISEIIKLLIIFDIRGLSESNYINEQVDNVFKCLPKKLAEMELEPEDRMHPDETTVKESFRHQFILHVCYDILKGNDLAGIAKSFWDGYKKNLVPCFYLTDQLHPFVTSEHPAFININENGQKEHIFVASPTMLIIMKRGCKDHFHIDDLSGDEVEKYNKIIIKNNKYIISCINNINL